ncbi:hypothetical protein [Pyramidobacter sp.]|uniref:hypothetical protein n=1 Tax=Pyramidobacter sp. TaxID=1943581 RepID=UPI00332AF421
MKRWPCGTRFAIFFLRRAGGARRGAGFGDGGGAVETGRVSAHADADDPKAWKVALDVSQDALKFTSLWVEYAKFDEGFVLQNTPYAFNDEVFVAPGVKDMLEANPVLQDMNVIFVGAKQKWNDKWHTFERYAKYDMDKVGDAKEWTVGVGYQYSPNLRFELAYNDIDVSDDAGWGFKYDDNQIRFRTFLAF